MCPAVMLNIGGSSIRRSTLGARGFSCAVSGFGQVLKSGFAARVFGVRPNTCRPAADETKLPRRTREKTSGTQGRETCVSDMKIVHKIRSERF